MDILTTVKAIKRMIFEDKLRGKTEYIYVVPNEYVFYLDKYFQPDYRMYAYTANSRNSTVTFTPLK